MKKAIAIAILIVCATMANAQLKVGDLPPEISLPNAKDSVINLSSFKGKVVLLDFWASWCAPCRAANPSVVKLHNKYRAKGFEVFGISIDSKKAAWLKAIKDDKIKYIQVNDAAGWKSLVAEKYQVEQIPTSFLLDKTGKIVAIDLEGAHLENKIKQLL
ncbi:MAG: TlpA disulfide reductase family protein [Ferruginibacter sp.]